MEVVQERKDRTELDFANNKLSFHPNGVILGNLKKSCYDVTYDANTVTTTLYFYNFLRNKPKDSTYYSMVTYLDWYLNNPGELALVNIKSFHPDEETPYKITTLSGTIDRSQPIIVDVDPCLPGMGFLKLVLINTKSDEVFFEPAKLTFKEKFNTWFANLKKNALAFVKSFLPEKPDPTTLKLVETSYAAIYTKKELEGRIFDTEAAAIIAATDLKGIDDPKLKIIKIRGMEIEVKE